MTTLDDFFVLVEKSGLLPDPITAPFAERARAGDPAFATPESAAKLLVRERLLTGFQARQLLRGRHRGFFLSEKYKILDLIGEGGMGRVLLCEHMMLHRLVAVKVLTGDVIPGAAERFLREARAAAALDDPNVVRIFDVDRSPAGPFMVMEYVDGTNFHQLVAQHGPMAVDRAAESIRQAALGLQHAHEMGLIHRDIKPGNLLLDRSGVVKLLDLGLARFFDASKNDNLTKRFDAKSVLGTADFIAPEQAMNSSTVDVRADIYSLGCTFYYMLVRKFPFEDGSVTQKLLWHQNREPTPVSDIRPDVPEGLAAVLVKMMKKKRDDRYQTPGDVVAALAPWTSIPIDPPPDVEMPKVRPGSYRLGLCPPPSSAVLSVSEAATPSPGASDVATGVGTGSSRRTNKQPRTPSSQQPATDPLPVPQSAPTDDHTPVGTTGSVRLAKPDRRHVLLLVAGALGGMLLLGGVSFGIWLATKPHESNAVVEPPNPIPVPATGLVLKGGGSTFAQPAVEVWSDRYAKATGTQVEYDAVGSSRGIRQMTEQVLDFGCTDAPLADDQFRSARAIAGEVVHVPLVLGAVVPTYNLPGAPAQLRFTGPILADIYLGKITKWNDPAIALTNPSVALPDLPIIAVRRSDGSGTTFIWTEYLGKVSSEWSQKVGAKTEPTWPELPPLAGGNARWVAARGNDGVAREVSRNAGAIGYVEVSYAVQNNLPAGQVKNQAGRFVAPMSAGVTAAAAAGLAGIKPDLVFSLTDPPGADSYPISGATWAVLYLAQPAGKRAELVRFLRWIVHDGQALVADLKYAPLPAELVRRIDPVLDRVAAGK